MGVYSGEPVPFRVLQSTHLVNKLFKSGKKDLRVSQEFSG